MKSVKKSIASGIAAFLLLCFAVTVLPMDFFHDHAPEQIVCNDGQPDQPCKHKLHVSSKKSYCWVCAIHFDSQYTIVSVFEKISSFPSERLYLENEITGFFFQFLFPELRGPPQN